MVSRCWRRRPSGKRRFLVSSWFFHPGAVSSFRGALPCGVGQRGRTPRLGRRHSLVNVSWAWQGRWYCKKKQQREHSFDLSQSHPRRELGARLQVEEQTSHRRSRFVTQLHSFASTVASASAQSGDPGREKNFLCLACVIRIPTSFMLHLKWEPSGAKKSAAGSYATRVRVLRNVVLRWQKGHNWEKNNARPSRTGATDWWLNFTSHGVFLNRSWEAKTHEKNIFLAM